jgi:LysR family transcriptional regulator, transcriptional activator of the cysJI operon
VEHLSFTKAANSLKIDQLAVSMHIEEMEDHYKTNLFERKSNKIYLSEAGQKVHNALKTIDVQYRNLDFEISELQNAISGEFKNGSKFNNFTIYHS